MWVVEQHSLNPLENIGVSWPPHGPDLINASAVCEFVTTGLRYLQFTATNEFLQRIIIGSDQRPDTKQGIKGKIVRLRSGRVRHGVRDKDRRSKRYQFWRLLNSDCRSEPNTVLLHISRHKRVILFFLVIAISVRCVCWFYRLYFQHQNSKN